MPISVEDGGPERKQGSEEDAPPSPPSELPRLPNQLPEGWQKNLPLLEDLHLVLQDIIVENGTLICPESGREFPVERGIPNMLLHDDEI